MIASSLAWSAWGLAALAAGLTVRNPYVQLVLLIVLVNVWLADAPPRSFPLRTAAALAILPVIFSFVFSRFGNHPLFTLPTAIPLLGGRWTLDAALYGATTGAALALIVLSFAILQRHVRTADLLAVLPAFLQRGGGLVALALAFLPQTRATLATVMEVRRVRQQSTGWRAAPALFLPVVLTALERALQYAESLDARGFGAHHRTRYRPLGWTWRDTTLSAAAALSLIGLVVAAAPPYDAYAGISPQLPGAASVVAIALLATPALAALVQTHAPAHV
jgi:energy-coupling factor transport system permease protein